MTRTTPNNWQSVGQLELLLQPDSLQQLLADSGVAVDRAACNYIRLKPGESALVGIDMEATVAGESQSLRGYVRTHEGGRATELASKWHADRTVPTPLGQGVRLLKGDQSVLFVFPNDARLRGLQLMAEPDKLKRVLLELDCIGGAGWRVRGSQSRLETVRYKPERRLILTGKLDLKREDTDESWRTRMFLRFFTDDRGRRIADLCNELQKQAAGRVVPRPLGSAVNGQLFVEEAVKGIPMLPRILKGEAHPEPIAEALSLLHGAQVASLPAVGGRALRTAEEAGGNLKLVAAELGGLVDQVLKQLRQLAPKNGGADATLHGDCHLHQFLNTRTGPVMVDFERAARGNPVLDLGHFTAHLEILALREPGSAAAIGWFVDEFLSCYARHNPDANLLDLAFFRGCGIMERALLPFRRVQDGWLDSCRQLLELALSTVARKAQTAKPKQRRFFRVEEPADDEPAWQVFYPRPGLSWPGFVETTSGVRIHGVYLLAEDRFQAMAPGADPALPGLAEWAAKGELRSHRIGRRATVVLQQDGGERFVKLVRPGKVDGIRKRLRAMAEVAQASSTVFPITPHLAGADTDTGALSFDGLDGRALHSLLMANDAALVEHIQAAARTIAGMHGAPVPDWFKSAARPHASAAVWTGYLAGHDQELESACRHALDSIEALPAGPFGPADRLVHGDLHDRNILATKDGIALIDLDGLGRGDPVQDVGNLAAHLVLRNLQSDGGVERGREHARAFQEAYVEAGGHAPMAGVHAVGARTLFRLTCFYRFRRRWQQHCHALLNESVAWADGTVLG